MTRPGTLGIVVAGSPRDAAAQAVAAERAGIDHVWVHEAGTDATVAAAAIATATTSIGIGTNVQVAFARSPTLAAFSAWDLQGLSDGRFTMGLGSQVRAIVEQGFAAAFDPPAARMAEYLQVVAATHATLGGTPTTWRGEYYDVTRPAPYGQVDADRPRPRVMLAAVGPLMVATAATHADGLLGHPFTSQRFLADAVVPRVDAALAAADRSRAAFTLATGVITVVDVDRDRARRRARRQVAFYGSTPAYRRVFAATGHQDLAETCRAARRTAGPAGLHDAVPDDLVDLWAVAGTPDEVAHRVATWRGLVDHLILCPPTVGLDPGDRAAAAAAVADVAAGLQ